ncbi:ABC transporter substrate-binding protein [Hoeflea alexandrii]|uniref:ABC transporter substrate-binding protein n=1 Tax=Hoeflea alexandrii TaxID=288436 RepID=UPI0022B05D7E|nr:ABC transporter substrate-binding protein [Hoeflea alexandrii]MCZ4291674.1 ABC transporter substrate-binding protein [Hoeflea alexandrii]
MKNTITRTLKYLGTTAAAALIATAPLAAQEKEPLKIGLLLSLSGPAAPFGIPERDAIQTLAAQTNAEGGINGHPVELVVYDDATNPTEAARGMRQLALQDKVHAVIGSTIGSGTLAAAPIAAQANVPVLAPNGTDAVVSPDQKFFPWVFRALPSDSLIGEAFLARALEGGAKKVALFYQEDAYGKGMHDRLEHDADTLGFELVASVSAPLSATDVTPQATRIRNAEPEVVLIQASAPALGASFVRAAKQVGLDAQIWAQGALAQQSFIDASGEAGEGVNLIMIANWADPTPDLQEFADLLTAAGTPPQGFGEILGANAYHAIVAAAEKLDGDFSGPALRDALEQTCDIKVYTAGFGCYSADNHEGWTAEAMLPAVIKGGKFMQP